VCRELSLFSFPFDETRIPFNGIYVLFEAGETGHGARRVVRVGTHTGNNQLRSRLREHFINPNKDRSIFRKNIGRALLNREQDPFLAQWDLDLTTNEAKRKHGPSVDLQKQLLVEQRVTDYIQKNFRFVVFEVGEKGKRIDLEARIISTVSLCHECGPSREWLGLHSPKAKIRESGLWLVNELYGEPLSESDLASLEKAIMPSLTNNRGAVTLPIGSVLELIIEDCVI
jgi:hypothetical protein